MRKLLLPLSQLYGAGVWLHNALFDFQIKKSVEFEIPVIGIGNLSMGGTGKTPHVEYILKLLNEKYNCGVLSRGYGRKTSGYILLTENSQANEVGDEPLQIKKKFPGATIAVCEERAIGIPIMLLDNPQLEVILLDDSFQHRRVKPLLSILLTDHSNLFTRDYLFPAGSLREPKQNASRAEVIVITKCPANISDDEKRLLLKEVRQDAKQKVFFSSLKYGETYHLFFPEKKLKLAATTSAILMTGIAAPTHLENYLRAMIPNLGHIKFSDHHNYSLREMKKIAAKLKASNSILLTTEKDGVRLLPFKDFFLQDQIEIFCVPVEVVFEGSEKRDFDSLILDSIERKMSAARITTSTNGID